MSNSRRTARLVLGLALGAGFGLVGGAGQSAALVEAVQEDLGVIGTLQYTDATGAKVFVEGVELSIDDVGGATTDKDGNFRIDLVVLAIVRTHSAFVWLTIAVLPAAKVITKNSAVAQKFLVSWLKRFTFVLAFAVAIGYLQYLLGVPIGLITIRVFVSVAVWLCVKDVYFFSRLSTLPNSVIA